MNRSSITAHRINHFGPKPNLYWPSNDNLVIRKNRTNTDVDTYSQKITTVLKDTFTNIFSFYKKNIIQNIIIFHLVSIYVSLEV